MSAPNTYKFEPVGFEAIRSDGFIYANVINGADDDVAKRGLWFMQKFCKALDRNDTDELSARLLNPISNDIVVAANVIEPYIHVGQPKMKHDGGIPKYVGFGFGQKLSRQERVTSHVDVIIVDPALTAVGSLVRVAIESAIIDESKPDNEISWVNYQSAMRIKSFARYPRGAEHEIKSLDL